MADVKRSLFYGHRDCGGGGERNARKGKSAQKDKNDGGLGWRRIRLTIQPLSTVSIDTGIGGHNRVKGEPPLGSTLPEDHQPPFTNPTGSSATSLLVPVTSGIPASRLMVIPLPPINNWTDITMPTEPRWNTATKTAWIVLANTNELLPMEINLLVYDPLRHSPGKADTYTSGAA